MDVSIIIVNYNTKELLINCINSIYKHSKELKFEIIVVDNASTDGSQELVKAVFHNVILIESELNLGFGRANNLGSETAKGDFLFFLNSDTILIEDSLSYLFTFFKDNEKSLNIGVLGALLVDTDLKINGFGNHFPSCKEEINKSLRKIPLFNSILPKTELIEYIIEKDFFDIDYVIGADMFMKKSLFEKLNGFSKDFFMYYEESDLQKRMDNLGFKRYVVTKTKIIHLEDGSGKAIKKYSNKKRIIAHRSRNFYLKKNDKSDFLKYAILDIFMLFLNFLNFKYSFKENLNYFKEVYTTY